MTGRQVAITWVVGAEKARLTWAGRVERVEPTLVYLMVGGKLCFVPLGFVLRIEPVFVDKTEFSPDKMDFLSVEVKVG